MWRHDPPGIARRRESAPAYSARASHLSPVPRPIRKPEVRTLLKKSSALYGLHDRYASFGRSSPTTQNYFVFESDGKAVDTPKNHTLSDRTPTTRHTSSSRINDARATASRDLRRTSTCADEKQSQLPSTKPVVPAAVWSMLPRTACAKLTSVRDSLSAGLPRSPSLSRMACC